MRAMRYGKRQAFVAALLLLAGAFLWQGRRSLNGNLISPREAGGGSGGGQGDLDPDCHWEEGGPVLYLVDHCKEHPSATHWFHVGESFTGRRADLKETIAGASGTVFFQVQDSKWMANLSPMTRLLVVSALTSVDTDSVHFVDTDRTSLVFSSKPTPRESLAPPTQQASETDELQNDAPRANGAAGSMRGANRRQEEQQQQTQQAGATEDGQPRPGQVGMLAFDPRGRGSEFVVSPDAPLPDRLTFTTDAGKTTATATETGPSAAASFVSAKQQPPVCVKYLETVGEELVTRADWFPSPADAESLWTAIDAYCPVPFLRDGRTSGAVGGERRRGVAEGGAGGEGVDGDGGGDGLRRLLLYQRDRNRKMRNPQQVIADLQERLGDGWIVEEMVHENDRHPCELVETLGSVDVLLTAHGFQSMLGLFMRPGSLLFEVFPHKYYKAGYGPMAEGLGVRHAFSMSRSLRPMLGFSHPSTETCMKWHLCRSYARSSDVELDQESFERLVELALV